MLCKLAWGNVRRAGRDYLVYLFTLTLGVTVFYAFNTVSMQADLTGIARDGLREVLGSTLSGLTYFLAAIMAFLMVYANNYIMKRRKKEFGLYQVLGMGRGRVATVMALETAIVSGVALVLGLVLGVMLSWVMTFFTASLFKVQVANFQFFFSSSAALLAIECLAAIFVLTLVFNLRTVRRARLIDLMGAERANEAIKVRNYWVSAAIFVVGVVLVGVAYARLLRDGFPISAVGDELHNELFQFNLTTVMVIVGTVMLFYGLSGILLKVVQGLRGVYWRGLNMFTVRQLAAKVNTVCASMSIIAMVLFLAITSVTTGMSLAAVMNENLERYNPVDWSLACVYNTQDLIDSYASFGDDVSDIVVPSAPIDMAAVLNKSKFTDADGKSEAVDLESIAGDRVQVDLYLTHSSDAEKPAVTPQGLSKATGVAVPTALEGSNAQKIGLYLIPESQYNALLKMRGLPQVDLGENGYLITSDMGDTMSELYNAALSQGVTVELAGRTLKPAAKKVDPDASAICNSAMGGNPGSLVVPDSVIEAGSFEPYSSSLLLNYRKGISTAEGDKVARANITGAELNDAGGKNVGSWGVNLTRTEMYTQASEMTGLVSYLSIFIGFVLVVACAAILTIQQLSSVADAGSSCRILAELGCEPRQIEHSMLAQQAIFFLFPLAIGIAHSVVALHVIIDLVSVFGNMSIGGMVGLTCAIFLAAYGGYFLITYLMSKGIVTGAIRTRHAE